MVRISPHAGAWLVCAMCAVHPAAAVAQTGAVSVDARQVDAGIQDALKHYADAFQNLDAAGVKRVQPSANEASLQSAFREMRALEVTIYDVQVLSQDSSATRVSCRVRQTLTPKAGSR